jgi:hypothetical protein
MRIFLKILKHVCNDLGLDDMYTSLPGLKCRPSFLMLHRHKVNLFAIQSFFSFFYSLAHLSSLYANPPLKYKCSAHPGLSTMITTLIVYQV